MSMLKKFISKVTHDVAGYFLQFATRNRMYRLTSMLLYWRSNELNTGETELAFAIACKNADYRMFDIFIDHAKNNESFKKEFSYILSDYISKRYDVGIICRLAMQDDDVFKRMVNIVKNNSHERNRWKIALYNEDALSDIYSFIINKIAAYKNAENNKLYEQYEKELLPGIIDNACKSNDVKSIELAIKIGLIDPDNFQVQNNVSLLQCSYYQGNKSNHNDKYALFETLIKYCKNFSIIVFFDNINANLYQKNANNEPLLHQVLLDGNYELLYKILSKDTRIDATAINIQDKNGMTLLHHLSSHSNPINSEMRFKLITMAINKGADISILNNFSQSALHCAYSSKPDFKGTAESMLRILLSKSIDDRINSLDRSGMHLLWLAIADNNYALASTLLKRYKFDCNIVPTAGNFVGKTLLQQALANKEYGVLYQLIMRGAKYDVNSNDSIETMLDKILADNPNNLALGKIIEDLHCRLVTKINETTIESLREVFDTKITNGKNVDYAEPCRKVLTFLWGESQVTNILNNQAISKATQEDIEKSKKNATSSPKI